MHDIVPQKKKKEWGKQTPLHHMARQGGYSMNHVCIATVCGRTLELSPSNATIKNCPSLSSPYTDSSFYQPSLVLMRTPLHSICSQMTKAGVEAWERGYE